MLFVILEFELSTFDVHQLDILAVLRLFRRPPRRLNRPPRRPASPPNGACIIQYDVHFICDVFFIFLHAYTYLLLFIIYPTRVISVISHAAEGSIHNSIPGGTSCWPYRALLFLHIYSKDRYGWFRTSVDHGRISPQFRSEGCLPVGHIGNNRPGTPTARNTVGGEHFQP